MNWNNLQKECCPKCGYKLERIISIASSSWYFQCLDNADCEGFKITKKRMEEIVEGFSKPKRCGTFLFQGQEHNLSDLNNLKIKR